MPGEIPRAGKDPMYVALRELRRSPGRFALIGAVVALMMLLVGFVSGLAGGLGQQNVSALLETGADRVVFAMPSGGASSFAESKADDAQLAAWQDGASAAGAEVTPIGIATVRVERPGDADSGAAADAVDTLPVALFGAPAGGPLAATGLAAPAADDELVLGASIAEQLGVSAGDGLEIAGVPFTVAEVRPQLAYSHLPVAISTLAAEHAVLDAMRQPHGAASVVLVHGELDGATAAALDAAQGTTSEPLLPSTLAISSFKSEIGSLGLMIAMLAGTAVLVVGVFFLVWSMQRQREVAVLKALGAKDGWLRRDALGQAALVLVVGVAVGAGLTLALGALAGPKVPVLLSWWTIGIPAVGMLLAGLLGSLVSLRQITKADPLTALAAA
ncbi:hypothetical protein USB125703_00107 [Pseudoclavibacter triregionum]|nr:hypothetical protein USB125703_00107 [Pseudoclavibacter triregionum]